MPFEPEYITGIEAVTKVIGKAVKETNMKIAEGIERASHIILKKALFYAPIDTGALRASGRVETTGTGKGSRSKVIFGGTRETYYALYVHENLEAAHNAPTCAKFLEKAARETAGSVATSIMHSLGGRSKMESSLEGDLSGKAEGTGYTAVTDMNALKFQTGSGKNVAYQTSNNTRRGKR